MTNSTKNLFESTSLKLYSKEIGIDKITIYDDKSEITLKEKNTVDAVLKLKNEGYHIMGIEQADKSSKLNDFTLANKPIAIVMGDEVKGVSQEVIDICNEVMEIPQFGTKHSLNISVSIGVVLWDLFYKVNQ